MNGKARPDSKIILVTGASSGFGALTARALADAGHTVYAGMRDTAGRNAPRPPLHAAYADEHGVDLRAVELDVPIQESVGRARSPRSSQEHGRIDVVVHNAGHMVLGPTEAFTPEQLADVYDTNVLGTQRVNRAALPHLRTAGDGCWCGSAVQLTRRHPALPRRPTSRPRRRWTALAVSYAAELARFGIETTIVVPGSFTCGHQPLRHTPATRPTTTWRRRTSSATRD